MWITAWQSDGLFIVCSLLVTAKRRVSRSVRREERENACLYRHRGWSHPNERSKWRETGSSASSEWAHFSVSVEECSWENQIAAIVPLPSPLSSLMVADFDRWSESSAGSKRAIEESAKVSHTRTGTSLPERSWFGSASFRPLTAVLARPSLHSRSISLFCWVCVCL